MSKTNINGLNGAHTAGIFADMTVDGPEIGTLVVIVDRAKNLPNRKSMGKQDPYCAARLGKEAKKTETDRRGGQTPKWDQELRFTVHDSPDYYQLKVSLFNDDKKTEIIGETWVNLQDVVVPGGGQNDLWHSLSFKGKYAGEIRIEITYYDSRPKQEKVSERIKQGTPNGQDSARDSARGPRELKGTPKRRPLPADPTGATPIPADTPDNTYTPPRSKHISTYIQSQSPLQTFEYNTPIQATRTNRPPAGSYGPSSGAIAPSPDSRPDDPYRDYASVGGQNNVSYDPIAEAANRFAYEPQQTLHNLPPPRQEYEVPPSADGPPPPPPVHRSAHHSPSGPFSGAQEYKAGTSTNTLPFTPIREDNFRHTLPSSSHPYSSPIQQQRYDSYQERNLDQSPPHSAPRNHSYHNDGDSYDRPSPYSAPRHHSYDERYQNYEPKQSFIESAPNMPPSQRSTGTREILYDDRARSSHSPAPLNLSGRVTAASGKYNSNTDSPQSQYGPSSLNNSPVAFRQPLQVETSSRFGYSHPNHSEYANSTQLSYRQDDILDGPSGGYVPPMPSTLRAGMDPNVAREISERMYENHSSPHSTAYVPRDRDPYQPNYRHEPRFSSPQTGAPALASHVFGNATPEDRQARASTNTFTPVVKPRAISPNPTIQRKSISPSVSPAAGSQDSRRLSGIPFGPDAYDALNPNVPTSVKSNISHARPIFDPEAKIIMHDGREIDPSDHLPESTWAAEPEVRGSKKSPSFPIGPQPLPNEGRWSQRESGRPQSLQPVSPHGPYMSGGLIAPQTPPTSSTGRNRLQKKTPHRNSNAAPTSSPHNPQIPLQQISPHQDNSANGYGYRGLPRATTIDFAGENRHPGYASTSSAPHRNSYGGGGQGPPIPAKLPMTSGGPPPDQSAWALLEEMRNIDLGTGRARRRG